MTEEKELTLVNAAVKAASKMGELYRTLVNTGVPEETAQQMVLETWHLLTLPPPYLELSHAKSDGRETEEAGQE